MIMRLEIEINKLACTGILRWKIMLHSGIETLMLIHTHNQIIRMRLRVEHLILLECWSVKLDTVWIMPEKKYSSRAQVLQKCHLNTIQVSLERDKTFSSEGLYAIFNSSFKFSDRTHFYEKIAENCVFEFFLDFSEWNYYFYFF